MTRLITIYSYLLATLLIMFITLIAFTVLWNAFEIIVELVEELADRTRERIFKKEE